MIFRIANIITGLFLCLMMFSISKAGVSVPSGLTYERKVFAGDVYKGSLQLQNTGNEPQEVKIYQTDYMFYADGRTLYGEPGTSIRSNADWITFVPQQLIIPAHKTAVVDYTVEVPNDETLTGTYWSMLMVEGISAHSPEAVRQRKEKITFGLNQVIRYGAQIVTQIGDTGDSNIKFISTKLLKENGQRILQVDLENTGQRWLKPALWAELYDEKGISAGKFEAGTFRIYPGTSLRFRLDMSQVPEGTYKALVVTDCGDDALFGGTYTFKFKGP